MDSDQLKPWQARTLVDAFRPMFQYLSKLKRRMEETGFPPDDRLYQLVAETQSLTQDLHMELHYLSCEHGVGRPRSHQRDSQYRNKKTEAEEF